MDALRENWNHLNTQPWETTAPFYAELVQHYSSPKRHYHTLEHIAALLRLTEEYQAQLHRPDLICWAVWYHDVVYNARKQNNEEKSAELAQQHLPHLGVPSHDVSLIAQLILATKTHTLPPAINDFDGQFFMDIDLSILATEPEVYTAYTQQIRQEYKMFPNILYNPGRKKVIKHFLAMDRIYKTELFFDLWEERARANLKGEL